MLEMKTLMSGQQSFRIVRLWVAAMLLGELLLPVHAGTPAAVVLSDSIKPVEVAPQAGPVNPHRPYISRSTLTDSESAASMDFEVALKMHNFSELQTRLDRGERISPQEMAARYEPLTADYEAVAAWVRNQGLTITREDGNHLAIFARGNISQIAQALRVTFSRVTFEGKEYTSAIDAPSVPATLSPILLGINGLQPHIRPHSRLIVKPSSLTGTNPPYLPSQIAQADNATSLYSSNITGEGESIAIVIATFPYTSDLVSFWTTYGVNQTINNIQFIQVVSGTLPAPSGEETLDTEWSSSIAPGARVRIYATNELLPTYLDEAYQQVYNDAINHPEYGLHQMSMSYGLGETYYPLSQVQTFAQYFANLASAGVTLFASSGDGGSTPGTGGAGDASGPLQVESPASDVNVTGVGGTTLTLNSNGSESSEVAWSYSGGGLSVYFQRPSWQTGTGMPAGTMRAVPDVAGAADPNTGAVFFFENAQSVDGGTSWSCPTWAGYCALINQARSNAGLSPIGLLGPQIYPLIGSTNFRDITSGSNSVGANSGGNYSAGIGYDPVTGIGVPLMQTLTQTLVGSSQLLGVQIQPVFQSVVPGQSASYTVSASGNPTSYQWQRMPLGSSTWSNLSDTGAYSGSATPTLTVNPATSAMSGDRFQCVVHFASSAVTSAPNAVLTVETPLTIATLAGQAGVTGNTATSDFHDPTGVALDTSGNLYIADWLNSAIRKVTPAGVVTTPYAGFKMPYGVAADGSNNLYVADQGANLIQKITASTGTVSTLAPSTSFSGPLGVAVDSQGNIYVADSGNNIIRKITSGGTVTTLAGNAGTAGYLNGIGTSAEFNNPTSLAVDSFGNVYVADLSNEVIREINPSGTVTTFAGQPGVAGYMDGPAAQALFNRPIGVTVDGSGNVYVSDSLNPGVTGGPAGSDLFRKITPAGAVSTLAGQAGVAGSSNGLGSAAHFYSVRASAINSWGEFYFADAFNQLIREGGILPAIVAPPLGQVITVGGPVTFSATASGTGPFAYQWLKNNAAISGATGSTYSVASVAAGDAGDYAVTVANSFGNVTSSAATLIPVTSQPVAQDANIGQTVTFSINVVGPGPLTYQWLFNGVAISGATGSSYTIQNASASNAGSYSVVVSDANGIVTTNPVSLSFMASDTPTMPQWGLIVMAFLLIWVASRQRARVA
ncbi:MAG: IPTL-CTERM sorting domain-containing protein [Verrucomicrobia bacterium]|nr:IPTL-CTERM sorting domain-containing protein [Verrucomicrobiota bacterium]